MSDGMPISVRSIEAAFGATTGAAAAVRCDGTCCWFGGNGGGTERGRCAGALPERV
jgi:hypothetical protein